MKATWLLVFLALGACRRSGDTGPSSSGAADAGGNRAAWPPLPRSEDAGRLLVEARSRTVGRRPSFSLDASTLSPRLLAVIGRGDLVVGYEAIDSWLATRAKQATDARRSFYLLWGTHHDSSAQLDAFRRLTGPTAITRWDRVVVEQLRADGRWAGVPLDAQRGESEPLRRWSETGAKEALASIAKTQERDDYAAWKFGHIDSILGIVADGRSAGHPVDGCDMPASVQDLLGPARASHGNALRELHCALALADEMKDGDPKQVAVLWGMQHVGTDGFGRFLPPESAVLAVRLANGRPPSAADPATMAVDRRFALVEPVLIPDAVGNDAVVILGNPSAEVHFERKRVFEADAGAVPPRIVVSSALPTVAEISVDGHTVKAPGEQSLPPGRHVMAATVGGRTLIASVVVPTRGWLELRLERSEPEMTVTVHAGVGE